MSIDLERLNEYGKNEQDYLLYCMRVANKEPYEHNQKHDKMLDELAVELGFSHELAAYAVVSYWLRPSRKESI